MPDTLTIQRADAPLGAEIAGVDLSEPLDTATAQAVHGALIEHGVICFRDQRITQRDLVRFTEIFGRPVPHVREQPEREVEEIFVISNVKENGQPIGALGNAELSFHSDLSYMPGPGTVSALYAIELPSTGGATHWCDCRAAYEALDAELKSRIAGLRAVHRHYVEAQNPPDHVSHPVSITHPVSGRKALYVGPHLTKYIVGLAEAESAELLGRLFEHVTQPQFIYTHAWRLGDLVVWDNRSTMHRRDPFPDEERRVMWRTQVYNDEAPVE